ncbi:hypothetical protein QIT38_gp40 [Methanocaldococcus fervens tailed virus 1]|uniref:Uncharacterized protein n=1 Tax=Methanocaldococcus fervens tailed virus 1 TaxID=2759191 RepID=A0A7G9VYU4_9CAUD|nr:hypothetical protein QIT38_gp40 [Methanocaldococcus fervens tailed virus 1]QNO11509.1 hypothetical protein [Methanocaldococcus fervens tailed virus 1]
MRWTNICLILFKTQRKMVYFWFRVLFVKKLKMFSSLDLKGQFIEIMRFSNI